MCFVLQLVWWVFFTGGDITKGDGSGGDSIYNQDTEWERDPDLGINMIKKEDNWFPVS